MVTKDKIFVDTAFFKALIDPKDDFYARAQQIWDDFLKIKPVLYTTNFILDEAYTLIRKRGGVNMAKDFYERWSNFDAGIKFIRVTVEDEKAVWNWFWKDWSKLSYTDCTSFAVMKRLGLSKVATFDEHFQKAGFEMLK
jgi:uncharacterized protein